MSAVLCRAASLAFGIGEGFGSHLFEGPIGDGFSGILPDSQEYSAILRR